MVNFQIKIPGYVVNELIYESTKTLLFQGVRELDQITVAIKILRNEYPSFVELAQFRHQYTITKHLDLPGIIKTYNLENYRNGYALVMEFGGISLKKWCLRTKYQEIKITPSLKEVLKVAIRIVSIIDGLHQSRVIHKDIKPANILINPSAGEVKLIDFSIASLIPEGTQTIINPNVLEGTLAYISPEQTGRMNRGIDYRTDFYSLGVTLYELFTKQLPFSTDDPTELVHCHIAKQPLAASNVNPKIPAMISDIIGKLMAKNPEDRYQSALGLKNDLEICLQQWDRRTNLRFELGIRDISDRFVILEKLYGRTQEIETLLAAVERVSEGAREVMLVAGFSGIGKTAVVNEAHKMILRQQGYFIKGKFDQLQRDIPLSAIIQALRNLLRQILSESNEQVEQWKTKINLAVGDNGQLIIDLIPELELLIGKQLDVAETEPNTAENRFKLVFPKFIRAFTSISHPLVMFLDDLQWADSVSLKLIQSLMSDAETYNLLLIGAYRDHEVSSVHPLILTLEEICQSGSAVNNIMLAPLTLHDLNCLVADTLHCSADVANPLTQLVFSKTQGNPFFIHQVLKMLHEDKLIFFDFDAGCWQWDIGQIQALSLSENIVEFMTIQLNKLPGKTQKTIKIAACIGYEFELNALATVSEKTLDETVSDLWHAKHAGLIVIDYDNDKLVSNFGNSFPGFSQSPIYRFSHDRVQQAAYSLIPEEQKKSTHLQIGQLLLKNISLEERSEKVFELVNHLNLATELITQQSERDELAHLNLVAGCKAKMTTAYSVAVKYLTIGIDLLGINSWENYELSLVLHETATEAAYLSGDFEQMEQLAATVLHKAKTILEQVKIYEIKIQAYTSRNRLLEAIAIARKALKHFGVCFPDEPKPENIQQELQETADLLAKKSIEDLINLPLMTEPDLLAIMRIISSAIPATYIADPTLFPLMILSQIKLSVQYGNAPTSAFFYACYSILLSNISQDITAAIQFSEMALSLTTKFNDKESKVRTYYVLGAFIVHKNSHIRKTLLTLSESYKIGLEIGDLESVGYAAKEICQYSYFVGQELTNLSQEIRDYMNLLDKFKQITNSICCQIYWQAVAELADIDKSQYILSGKLCTEEELLLQLDKANDLIGFQYFYLHKLILCYLFADFEQARANAASAKHYGVVSTGFVTVPIFYFYDSLVALAVYRDYPQPEDILSQVENNQINLQHWADSAPMNYLHKYYLVEAEKHRVLGEYIESMELYDRAITLAKENTYINDEALSQELAGKFYLEWGKDIIAQIYMTNAYYAYERWGAKAKLKDLQQHYPQLITSIPFANSNLLTFGDKNSNSITILNGNTTNNISGCSVSEVLDFKAVIKASQVISGSIELETLLSQLMQVVIENAGAQAGTLILCRDDSLLIEAQAACDKDSSALEITCLKSIPVQNSYEIPVSMINYVSRTSEDLIINDGVKEIAFASDPYIMAHQPKSVLCMPIHNKSKLIGVLYLENNLTREAFTRDRLQVLKLLITQAAISLENAILYQNLATANERLEDYNYQLEQKVAQRTDNLNQNNQQLSKVLNKLQSTQAQLIQTEKMSSLGQMVAGVAHEINNPINFIHGNIQYAHKYIEDLLKLISVYHQQYPEPTLEVIETMEEIELEFLKKDLPKLLDSMKIGSDRIRNIVLGLRNFSRLDEAEMKSVNIHEGIDNTLMILQHKLYQKSNKLEIKVIKEYSQLPEVTCYPSQLNQALMNILSNAIDALETREEDVSCPVSLPPPEIRICTELASNTVKIRIADNGHGMTEEVQQKIFDPFFTTKPIGSGTGLGLSISYQIVADKHQGRLLCNSQLGTGTEFIIEIPISQSVN